MAGTAELRHAASAELEIKVKGAVLLKMPVSVDNSVHEIYTQRLCHHMI
jgi:hypothetical protein